jgi:hypothetical protein
MISKIKSKEYREILIDTLCKGITNVSEFRDSVEYIIDQKLEMFDDDFFNQYLYEEDKETIITLILPSFRRVWGKVYSDTPSLFKKRPGDLRLELYQQLFNTDEFLDYLKEMFVKVKDSLKYFENLDRTIETLTLIVDNYIAGLIQKVLDSDDINRDIRQAKLNKII